MHPSPVSASAVCPRVCGVGTECALLHPPCPGGAWGLGLGRCVCVVMVSLPWICRVSCSWFAFWTPCTRNLLRGSAVHVLSWNGGHLEKPQLSPRLEMFPLVWCRLAPSELFYALWHRKINCAFIWCYLSMFLISEEAAVRW